MSIRVSLKTIAPFFDSIRDVDGDGFLSVAASADGTNKSDELVTRERADDGAAIYKTHYVSPEDLASYDAFGAWLTRATGRKVSVVFDAAAPAYLAFSQAENPELEGLIAWQSALVYTQAAVEERFVDLDFARMQAERDLDLAECEGLSRRSQVRACRKSAIQRHEALLKSAEAYTEEADKCRDAALVAATAFSGGTLDYVSAYDFVDKFRRAMAVQLEYYRNRLYFEN